jgi:hypothetical protein
MANKELTIQDAQRFWDYFDSEYPDLSFQLKSKSFINGSIVSHQPAKMKDEDYIAYNRIMYAWQIENGFWDELAITTSNNEKITFLRTDMMALEPIDHNSISVTIKQESKGLETYTVLESIEAFKNRLYLSV